jgi:hypothetical protein
VSLAGQRATCQEGRFEPEELRYWPHPTPQGLGSFLWSSLAAIPRRGERPGAGEVEALAGGSMQPTGAEGTELNSPGLSEPVIVQANCDGSMTLTRFRAAEAPNQEATEHTELTSGDRLGTVSAIAASASNDAWAATSEGRLLGRPSPNPPHELELVYEPPRLYQLTNGQPPEAPEGNEVEERFEELFENPPIFVFEPEPEQPIPPPPPPVINTTTTHEAAAVYGLKAQLRHHGNRFSLYLSFKLRRPVTLGAEGLRHGRVVARARPQHFAGHKGLLILPLDRKHWPTTVRFTS